MQKHKHREGGKEFSRAKFENITAVLNRCIQNDFCGRAQNLPDIWGETGKLIEASQSGDLRDPHFSVTFVGSKLVAKFGKWWKSRTDQFNAQIRV